MVQKSQKMKSFRGEKEEVQNLLDGWRDDLMSKKRGMWMDRQPHNLSSRVFFLLIVTGYQTNKKSQVTFFVHLKLMK